MNDWKESFYEALKTYFNSRNYGISQAHPIDRISEIIETYDHDYGRCGDYGNIETEIFYIPKNSRVCISVVYYGSLASLMEEL